MNILGKTKRYWGLTTAVLLLSLVLTACGAAFQSSVEGSLAFEECKPGNEVDMATFATNMLNTMQISVSQFALDAIAVWEPYENTAACWNPLATTYHAEWMPEVVCTETIFNSAGVRSYSSQSCGELASAKTLLYTTACGHDCYKPVRDMLSQQSFDWQTVHDSIQIWVGSEAYATELTNQWQTLWNSR